MTRMHLKVVVQGAYGVPALSEEEWSFGLKFACDDTEIPDVGQFSADNTVFAQDNADDDTDWIYAGNYGVSLGATPIGNDFDPVNWLRDHVAPAVKTFLTGDAGMSAESYITRITAYAMDSTGHVVQLNGNPAKATASPKSAFVGSDGNGLLPLQVACVASLGSFRGGASGRGRIYLPAMGPLSCDSAYNPWISAAKQSLKANGVKTMLNACAVSDGNAAIYVRPVVTGSANAVDFGAVKSVRIGRVFDTQRRRRDSLAENYVTATL